MNLTLPPEFPASSRSADLEEPPPPSPFSENHESSASDFFALMREKLARRDTTPERTGQAGPGTPRRDGLAAAPVTGSATRPETPPAAEPEDSTDLQPAGTGNGPDAAGAAEAIGEAEADEETDVKTPPAEGETLSADVSPISGWVPPLDLLPAALAAPLPPGNFGFTTGGDSERASASVRIEEDRPAAARVEADGTLVTGRGLVAGTNRPRADGAGVGTSGEAAPTSVRPGGLNPAAGTEPPALSASPAPEAARAVRSSAVKTQLPSPQSEAVEFAAGEGAVARWVVAPGDGTDSEAGAPPSSSTVRPGSAAMPARAPGGISTAEQGARMRLELLSPQGVENEEGGTREGAGHDDLFLLSPELAEGVGPAEAGVRISSPDSSLDGMEAAARRVSAMDWPMGRPAEIELSRPSPVEGPGALDRVAEIERLSHLMIRESTSLRQTGAESLAVVLRPDEHTQLFVEMAHREGCIEAQVRCERGDARHLGALWGQLQEALGQQNIRLAPLQDASGGGQAGSHGSPHFGAGDSADANADRHSPRQPAAEQRPWEERPRRSSGEGSNPLFRNTGPARPVAATGPGWETWA